MGGGVTFFLAHTIFVVLSQAEIGAYNCFNCKNVSKSRAALKQHVNKKHKDDTPTATAPNETEAETITLSIDLLNIIIQTARKTVGTNGCYR